MRSNWKLNRKSKKNQSKLKVIILIFILLYCLFIGSIEKNIDDNLILYNELDQPSILPDWIDNEYHDYFKTIELLQELNTSYPHLIDVFSIGQSVQGRNISCIRITNERNISEKFVCFYEGCIHGCEWEAGESCLYFAEYLLINNKINESIANALNTSIIYIIPFLNPDGRESDIRWNDNGIDLNRNFDVHFGRILSRNFKGGLIFNKIKIPGFIVPGIGIVSNCGKKPFSEPETKALKNFMKLLDASYFSFYISCHTAVHAFDGTSDQYYFPEYKLNNQQKYIIKYVKEWVNTSTEYPAYYQDFTSFGTGNSIEWVYSQYNISTFVLEILSKDYEPYISGGKHDNLTHWMKTSLSVYLYLLVNIENLYNWNIPDIEPLLPEGVPPDPI